MSHNVTLQGIKFADVEILEKAFLDLQADEAAMSGYKFVNQPTEVRGWYGRMTKVDAAIMCPGQRYDIGFVRDATGNLVPMMEHGFAAPGVATDSRAKTVEGQSCSYGHEQRALGKLQQRYAIVTAELNARRLGSMTRRINAADGQIQLEISHK